MDTDEDKKEMIDLLKLEKGKKGTHIPTYNYCGPGTPIVTNMLNNIKPKNDLDEGCQVHDIEYMEYAGEKKGIEDSDQKLIDVANNWREGSLYKSSKRNFFQKIGDWFSSKLVSGTFKSKKMLEKIRILDPVTFTNKLALKPPNVERRIGRILKRVYNSRKNKNITPEIQNYIDLYKQI